MNEGLAKGFAEAFGLEYRPMCAINNPEMYSTGDNYLCEQGQCSFCDQRRSQLVPIDAKTASNLLRNYTVYFCVPDGRMAFRSWWSKIDGHYHCPPEENELFGVVESVKKIHENRQHA